MTDKQRNDLIVGDTNKDGKPDTWVVDTDGNGVPDMYQFDTDHDGKVDVTLIDADETGTNVREVQGDAGFPPPSA